MRALGFLISSQAHWMDSAPLRLCGLLTLQILVRDHFVDQTKVCARIHRLGRIEVSGEKARRLIGSTVGQVMQPDRQGFRLLVGNQIRFGSICTAA